MEHPAPENDNYELYQRTLCTARVIYIQATFTTDTNPLVNQY